MRKFILILPLRLCGCAGQLINYQPYVTDVADPRQLIKDEGECLSAAKGYTESFDLANVGTQALSGAAGNAAGAAVDPLVPVLGAAGGASQALLGSVGLLGDKQRRSFLKCLEHRGERSHAYNVIDPNF
jgi:hypothetical protein